jgi:hypothetical protein
VNAIVAFLWRSFFTADVLVSGFIAGPLVSLAVSLIAERVCLDLEFSPSRTVLATKRDVSSVETDDLELCGGEIAAQETKNQRRRCLSNAIAPAT